MKVDHIPPILEDKWSLPKPNMDLSIHSAFLTAPLSPQTEKDYSANFFFNFYARARHVLLTICSIHTEPTTNKKDS